MRHLERFSLLASIGAALSMLAACGGGPPELEQLGTEVTAYALTPEITPEAALGQAVLDNGIDVRWEILPARPTGSVDSGVRTAFEARVELTPRAVPAPAVNPSSMPVVRMFLKCHTQKLYCYLGGFDLIKQLLRDIDPEAELQVQVVME